MTVTSLNKQVLHHDLRLASWLTVERGVYVGIALLALGVRLYGVGAIPLGPAEAAQALPAWAAVTGQPFQPVGASPLLLTFQRLAFAAFGAGDFWACFLPALLGGLAPIFFYGLRDRLSRGRADCSAAVGDLALGG